MLHPTAGSIRFDSAEDLDYHQRTTAIWCDGNKGRYSVVKLRKIWQMAKTITIDPLLGKYQACISA